MDVKDAVLEYLWQIAEQTDGHFELFDPQQQKMLALNLMGDIADERIFRSVEDETIVCSDMMSADGRIYDIDFIVTDTHTNTPLVRDVNIHKMEEYPRYEWALQDGVCLRTPVP